VYVNLDTGFPYCIQVRSREDLVYASRDGAGSDLYRQHLISTQSKNVAPSPEILTLVRKTVPVFDYLAVVAQLAQVRE
jgi:hypothetical protein